MSRNQCHANAVLLTAADCKLLTSLMQYSFVGSCSVEDAALLRAADCELLTSLLQFGFACRASRAVDCELPTLLLQFCFYRKVGSWLRLSSPLCLSEITMGQRSCQLRFHTPFWSSTLALWGIYGFCAATACLKEACMMGVTHAWLHSVFRVCCVFCVWAFLLCVALQFPSLCSVCGHCYSSLLWVALQCPSVCVATASFVWASLQFPSVCGATVSFAAVSFLSLAAVSFSCGLRYSFLRCVALHVQFPSVCGATASFVGASLQFPSVCGATVSFAAVSFPSLAAVSFSSWIPTTVPFAAVSCPSFAAVSYPSRFPTTVSFTAVSFHPWFPSLQFCSFLHGFLRYRFTVLLQFCSFLHGL